MPGIVLHRPHLGRGAERVRHPLGGPLVVGGEAHADMAVVEDRVVRAVSLLDLVERLRDEECLEAVARHERQGGLEEVEPAERGKLRSEEGRVGKEGVSPCRSWWSPYH